MRFDEQVTEKAIELVANLMRTNAFTIEMTESNNPKGLRIECEVSPQEMELIINKINQGTWKKSK